MMKADRCGETTFRTVTDRIIVCAKYRTAAISRPKGRNDKQDSSFALSENVGTDYVLAT